MPSQAAALVPFLLFLFPALSSSTSLNYRRYPWNVRTVQQRPVDCECNPISFAGDLTGGVFKSPQFPRSYCNELDCVYEIEPRGGEAIALCVEHFETEETHDYVEIYQMVWGNGSGGPDGAIYVKHDV